MAAGPDLDDPSLYPRGDPHRMRDLLEAYPRLCQEGWQAAAGVGLPAGHRRVDRLVFLGMGGSGIVGEMAAALLGEHWSAVPATVHRGYGAPPWVDSRTLVIASSYSGDTEETLSGVRAARERGARVLALTRGGALGRLAAEAGSPAVPVSIGAPPRAAFPYMLMALLRALSDLGLAEGCADGLREAEASLPEVGESLWPQAPASGNTAKGLARELQGRLPVIYGSGILSPVAYRWRTQINENAKAWAFSEELPEAHHNAVAGLRHPAGMGGGAFAVLLRPSKADARILLRYRITEELLTEASVPWRTVAAAGDSPLAQVLATTLLGDYVSYYLALLYGVDPTPVEAIDRVKRRLGEDSVQET